MGMYLSELIEQANICLKDLGLSSGTIDDYQCSAFRPIERRLGNPYITDSKVIKEQEDFFLSQFNDKCISRHTLNWRIRGIRILSEALKSYLQSSFQEEELRLRPERTRTLPQKA